MSPSRRMNAKNENANNEDDEFTHG